MLLDGPRTLREIARAAEIDPPAATVGVDQLEARGLAHRTPTPRTTAAGSCTSPRPDATPRTTASKSSINPRRIDLDFGHFAGSRGLVVG